MLIPLGFLGGGEPDSSMELITTSYGTGSSSSIMFYSIPQNYKHLQLRMVTQINTNQNGSVWTLNMNVNASGGIYNTQEIYAQAGTVTASYGTGSNSIGYASTVINTTAITSSIIMDILDYSSSSKSKMARSLINGQATPNSNSWADFSSMLIKTNSPITEMQIYGPYAFTARTRVSLYGIKGA